MHYHSEMLSLHSPRLKASWVYWGSSAWLLDVWRTRKFLERNKSIPWNRHVICKSRLKSEKIQRRSWGLQTSSISFSIINYFKSCPYQWNGKRVIQHVVRLVRMVNHKNDLSSLSNINISHHVIKRWKEWHSILEYRGK